MSHEGDVVTTVPLNPTPDRKPSVTDERRRWWQAPARSVAAGYDRCLGMLPQSMEDKVRANNCSRRGLVTAIVVEAVVIVALLIAVIAVANRSATLDPVVAALAPSESATDGVPPNRTSNETPPNGTSNRTPNGTSPNSIPNSTPPNRTPSALPPKRLEWYEEGPLVDMATITLPELKSPDTMNKLVGVGVAGIFVPLRLLSEGSDGFMKLAESYGIRVIVDMTLDSMNPSEKLFKMSERGDLGYADYFVWSNQSSGLETNGSAYRWYPSANSSKYYRSRMDESTADINLEDDRALNDSLDKLDLWMKLGAAGVRIDSVSGLKESELKHVLIRWRDKVKEYKNAVFTTSEPVLPNPELVKWLQLGSENPLIDIPPGNPLTQSENNNKQVISSIVEHSSRKTWPAVTVGSGANDGLMQHWWLVELMLPATPVFIWERIQLMNDNLTLNKRDIYYMALSLRRDMLRLPYKYATDVIVSNAKLAFSRYLDRTGYIVVSSTGASRANINLDLEPHPANVTIIGKTGDCSNNNTVQTVYSSTNFYITNFCGLLLSFEI